MTPPLTSNKITTNSSTIKFLYSYGGKILPRRTDGKLRYVGGFTRVLAVDRSLTFAELMVKFGESCGSSMSLRCKLPSEDLDVLISVTSDEDLASVIEEYDRHQDLKIRAILSPIKSFKQISPTPSAVSSVNFSPSESPAYKFAGVYSVHQQPESKNLQFGVRSSSQAVGYPVRFQKDGRTVCYHRCREQGRPRDSYFVPHWNH
ncbi:hypothetical protein LguiB_022729 [Lonicera macranthoides]